MDGNYQHHNHEEQIYEAWKKSGAFQPQGNGDPYVIAMPPPNVTGTLHAGHALFLTIEDIMTRAARMQGKRALWVPGTDHAAIATESVVLKHLGIQDRNKEIGREDFLKECRAWTKKTHATITKQIEKMGASCDWSREAFTFDRVRNTAVNEIFLRLYEKGLIYRGNRMVNWSTGAQSVLADDELEWDEKEEPFYSIRCGEFIVGTVRPETKCADSPVVVHPETTYVRVRFTPKTPPNPPSQEGGSEVFILAENLFDDEERRAKELNLLDPEGKWEILEKFRGEELVGRKFTYPTYAGERAFYVLADEVIDPDKGSGAMTISSCHSADDYEMATRLGLEDTFITKIDFEGKMTEIAGPCAGMPVEKARKVSAKTMREEGLLVGENKSYNHRVPRCYRSGCVVEPMISRQWFIDVNREFEDDSADESPLSERGLGDSYLPYDPKLKERARELRKNPTAAEKKMWSDILGRDQFQGLRFLRQKPIQNYIVDFYCDKLSLVIEIDGDSHAEQEQYDAERTRNLESLGIEVVRYTNDDVLNNMEGVYEDLEKKVKERKNKIPLTPFTKGGTTTLKHLMQSAVREEHVEIVPKRFEKTYFHWIDNLQDWCISRQIWWGHRIPVWYDAEEKVHLPERKTLFFARHGQSEANAENIFQGTYDTPLTEKGRQEAEALAEEVKTKGITKIVSSKLMRAKETAEIVAEKLGVTLELWDDLEENDFGQYNGKPKEEIFGKNEVTVQDEFEQFISKGIGEGFDGAVARARRVEKRLEQEKDERILVISHETFLATLFFLREHPDDASMENMEQFFSTWDMPNGAVKEQLWFTPPQGDDLRQDEDTLDTWFSSALWPFSIFGWPQENQELEDFYPTAVLETGHDILFFWVARMIMFGRFATGKYPFHTVYLHGLVRDEKGQKMSKSKGNGVDPLEIIKEYGADALRLALVMGTTPGNNSNLGMEKIRGCRNFCNKLWNITRFILGQEQGSVPKKPETELQAWLVEEVDLLSAAVQKDLETHQYGAEAEKLWNFTWNELADWGLEAAKAEKNPETNALLLEVLKKLLKLWHPYIPFVTEALWKELGEEALITASFPEAFETKKSGDAFRSMQQVIRSFRSMRKQAGIDPTKKIPAYIEGTPKGFEKNTDAIRFLAGLSELHFGDIPEEKGASDSVLGMKLFLPQKGFIDEAAEQKRLKKEKEKAETMLMGIEAKLQNKDYVKKAPAALVEKTRQQAEELKKKLETIEEALG